MPKGHIVTVNDLKADADVLRDRLEMEWRELSSPNEPVIIEEPSEVGNYKRIYIIWSLWHGVSQRDRSTIILQAYQNTHSNQELENVTVATGYTPDEAANRGIRYELE